MRRIIVASALILIFLVGASGLYLFFPNEIDNALGLHRASMIECTLKWGRLAPFPKEARDFTIRTEGTTFSREFRGTFSAQPQTVETWLKESAGVREGKMELRSDASTKYTLKPDRDQYGEVIISPDHTTVSFKVYSS